MVGGEHDNHTVSFPSCQWQSVSISPDGRRSKIEHSFVLHVPATAPPAPFKIFFLKHLFFLLGLNLRNKIQNPSTPEPILGKLGHWVFWGVDKGKPAIQLGWAEVNANSPTFIWGPPFLRFVLLGGLPDCTLCHTQRTDSVSLGSFTGGYMSL